MNSPTETVPTPDADESEAMRIPARGKVAYIRRDQIIHLTDPATLRRELEQLGEDHD